MHNHRCIQSRLRQTRSQPYLPVSHPEVVVTGLDQKAYPRLSEPVSAPPQLDIVLRAHHHVSPLRLDSVAVPGA
jgi:hypothetical protein